MAAQARDYWKGIFPPAYDYAGGLDEGDTAQLTTPNADGTPQVIKPSGTAPWLQGFYGVVQPRGTIGGSGTSAGEAIALKVQGLARIKLGANRAMTRLAQLINDPSTLGAIMARTAYSFSAMVIGYAQEALSSSSSAQMLEALIQPHMVEVVRQVTGFVGTIGVVTKYVNGIGGSISTTGVPMYLVRFTGETIRNLAINLGTAPGGTDTVAVTVYKSSDNGANWTATDLTCTATGTAKTASDLSHSVALTAGDLLAIYVNSSAVTAANLTVTFDIT